MKGLAEVKLLPRCLQLRTQPRLGKAGEGEGGDLTYTPLDVALLCCNTPVVYDILRRAGSSCFQHLPTNKSNALHNAVRGGRTELIAMHIINNVHIIISSMHLTITMHVINIVNILLVCMSLCLCILFFDNMPNL